MLGELHMQRLYILQRHNGSEWVNVHPETDARHQPRPYAEISAYEGLKYGCVRFLAVA